MGRRNKIGGRKLGGIGVNIIERDNSKKDITD